MTRYIDVEYKDNFCTIRFNRDEKRNAFSNEMSEEVLNAIAEAEKDSRAIVLSANPDTGVWSSGHDLSEIHNVRDLIDDPMFDLLNRIANCPVPVICAIDGDVYAGGFLIMLVSDIAIATERSRFCMPINKMGIPLPTYCYAFAISVLGARKAKEMFLCADLVGASDAYAQGLLNQVVPGPAQLEQRLSTVLKGIAACLPEGLAYTKSVFNAMTRDIGCDGRHVAALRPHFDHLAESPEIARRVDALISKVGRHA